MDPDEDVVGGARPKRLTRPPYYLQQYEVQYTRGRPVAEYDVSHTWESPVHRTPPPSFWPYITPPGGDLVSSDGPRIMSSVYQPLQQAEFPQPSFSSPQVAGFITSAHDSELQHLRHEHAQLMQTQQAFQADLRELREVPDLDQARGQNRSPVQPTASQLCSPPGKLHDSTPLAEDVNSAELPPPWPEPHVDLMNQVGDLALSDMGATIYQPVMPETRKYSFVCPAIQPLPPQLDAPHAFGLPPPPTPKELRELLTPVARPLPADRTALPVSPRFSSVPATSNPPGFALKAEPGLRPVAPYSGSEYVYRGPAPTIPKFSRPDPGEFARLRIALKNLLPPDGTELFKYQILVDHLKFKEARMIADAYLNSPTPFTDTMAALHDKFGQPHQLALRKITGVLESPDIKQGDISAFQKFALQVQSLVGLLRTLGRDGELELSCGSHVARLLNKLPPEQRAEFRRHMFRQPGTTPNLVDLSNWLRYETWCHSYDPELMSKGSHAKADSGKRAVTILHGVGESSVGTSVPRKGPVSQTKPAKVKRYCPFCDKTEHYLSQCVSLAKLTSDQVRTWIRSNNRCWRCARAHHAAHCDLKKPCNLCQGTHLRPLHEVNVSPSPREDSTNTEKSCLTNSSPDRLFLDKPSVKGRVMLKVVPVNLHYEDRTLDTFALLDDGSERTILLSTAVKALGIQDVPEDLPLRTVRDDIQVIQSCSISFHISPLCKPQTSYKISHAFTVDLLNLSLQSYPIEQLQQKYRHLHGLPIRTLTDVQPLLLIGSDQPHLITQQSLFDGAAGCLLTSMAPIQDELLQNVQRLWQLDMVPQWEGKEVTRSKQDQEALQLLDQKTLILDMEGIHRLATPLLRRKDMPLLKAPKESVLPTLRSVERRLLKDPLKAEVYEEEMRKLIKTGAVREVTELDRSTTEYPFCRAASVELWLTQEKSDLPESTLGLSWNWQTDTLSYKHRPVIYETPTLRNIYKVLATQYDPLGWLLPYTTRAKVIIKQLWDKQRGWDDPNLPPELLQSWCAWEEELRYLPCISFPRPYVPPEVGMDGVTHEVHIFSDASEQAYGAVAYLRTTDQEDSTTVLQWLNSESCRYRVFVGNRIAEIQELTDKCSWHYVGSADNPADDLTKGRPLQYLAAPNRWSQGPAFLLQDPKEWPAIPKSMTRVDQVELRKSTFCGINTSPSPFANTDGWNYNTWQELLDVAAQEHRTNLVPGTSPEAENYRQAEVHILRQVQQESFPEDYQLLGTGKQVRSGSRLVTLAPEMDPSCGLIRVGGRLRRVSGIEDSVLHPLVLDPSHPVSRLIIQHYDDKLHHPGSERLFGEIRRYYWILRGREAVRRFQRDCPECQRWRAQPAIPKMADLPSARLQLYKPAFHSCGVDCFGPLLVKIGRRTEKRWVPTHFSWLLKGLSQEEEHQGNYGWIKLCEAYAALLPDIQSQLACQQIHFHFNPPSAPHFGGAWEREVESILNSKSLGYVSSDVADVDPVTPNSLLMGRPDGSLPQVVYPESEMLSRRHWRHSQVLADRFRSRFIRDYLPSLQTRQKWHASPPDLKEQTFVLIIDPQLPRSLWPVGQVIKTHQSPDGHIRSAHVLIKGQVYTRPVARLVILPALPKDRPPTLTG
ncbi:hypothetical protein M9458_054146 [Cirrhinus mrigala]|uniref:Uncharacterized protein n=1 Tax=Cirrhinus mrigala TaxID=683832 RepID=A0ABD0MN61_CIRMR